MDRVCPTPFGKSGGMKTSPMYIEETGGGAECQALAEKTFASWQYRQLIEQDARVSSRVDESNRTHHLLRNIDGSYWVRVTVWYKKNQSERRDLPLFTHSEDMACRVRDIVLAALKHVKCLRRPAHPDDGAPRGFYLNGVVRRRCPLSRNALACSGDQAPVRRGADRGKVPAS